MRKLFVCMPEQAKARITFKNQYFYYKIFFSYFNLFRFLLYLEVIYKTDKKKYIYNLLIWNKKF